VSFKNSVFCQQQLCQTRVVLTELTHLRKSNSSLSLSRLRNSPFSCNRDDKSTQLDSYFEAIYSRVVLHTFFLLRFTLALSFLFHNFSRSSKYFVRISLFPTSLTSPSASKQILLYDLVFRPELHYQRQKMCVILRIQLPCELYN